MWRHFTLCIHRIRRADEFVFIVFIRFVRPDSTTICGDIFATESFGEMTKSFADKTRRVFAYSWLRQSDTRTFVSAWPRCARASYFQRPFTHIRCTARRCAVLVNTQEAFSSAAQRGVCVNGPRPTFLSMCVWQFDRLSVCFAVDAFSSCSHLRRSLAGVTFWRVFVCRLLAEYHVLNWLRVDLR